jgi:hypothetical protein
MKQIPLDDDQLRHGLDAEGVPTPDTPVLILASDPHELEARYGINLQQTHDDLGELALAMLESAAGTFFTLERHSDDPIGGTTVSFFRRDVAPERVGQVLRELDVPHREVRWNIWDSLEQNEEDREAERRPPLFRSSTKWPPAVVLIGLSGITVALIAAGQQLAAITVLAALVVFELTARLRN